MSSKFVGRFDNSMLEELNEFDKRYRDTFLWIKFKDKPWIMCHVDQIDESGVHFFNKEIGSVFLKTNTDIEIEVRWPETRYFNYKNTIYWCYKIPDRQWKRAPCAKNFMFKRGLDQLFVQKQQNFFNAELLEASFQPQEHHSILECINAFKDSNVSAATVSNKFAVSLPPVRKDFYLLWYLNKPVAEIHTNKEIVVKCEQLRQEIKDFNRDQEQSAWLIH